MKKTAISLLLAVAMVFSLVLVAAPVAQAAEHTDHCVCGGTSSGVGGHTCANVTWTKWEATDSLPTTAGNYYLDKDVTIATDRWAPENVDIVLCLNGHTVKSTISDKKQNQVLSLKANVTICDCDNTKGANGEYTFGGTVTSETTYEGSNGTIFYIQEGEYTMNIFGGNWIAPTAKQASGSIAYVSDKNVLNIYNGFFQGGTVTDRGGAINVSYGTVNMYGGTIKGGESVATDAAEGGGMIRVSGNSAGTKKAVFNMYGGTIEGGKANQNGGIFIVQNYATLNVSGGTIKGGTAGTRGGNIYVTTNGTVNITGGTITGGTAANGKEIFALGTATVKVTKLSGTTVVETDGGEKAVLDLSALDKSVSKTVSGNVTTLAPASAKPNNPATGDSANLVVMGLGLVLGVAGIACLLPKKQEI